MGIESTHTNIKIKKELLNEFVMKHCERGACTCGKCIDAPKNPEENQPSGHTEDLVFFKVKILGEPDKNQFLNLIKNEHPQWLDGEEHSYLEMGGDVGDQGLALMTMGLGKLIGAWELSTPNMISSISDELRKQMAGAGMITIKVTEI